MELDELHVLQGEARAATAVAVAGAGMGRGRGEIGAAIAAGASTTILAEAVDGASSRSMPRRRQTPSVMMRSRAKYSMKNCALCLTDWP